MRITHVLPYSGKAGTERFVAYICQSNVGISNHVVLLQDGDAYEMFLNYGIKCTIDPRPAKNISSLEARNIYATSDCIHYHTCGSVLQGSSIASENKRPLIVTVHWQQEIALVRALVVCPTPYVASLQHPHNKCIVIGNGIPIKRFHQMPRTTKMPPVLLRACRSDKCPPYFWRVMSSVLNLYPEAQLWIVGENGKSTQQIKYFGFVDDIYDFLCRADILVYPARPNVGASDLLVMEAMAAGCVPVVTNVPCVDHLVEHRFDGIKVEYGNCKHFEESIIELLTDHSLRQSLSSIAMKTARSRFDVRLTAAHYKKAYIAAIRMYNE